MSRIAAVIGTLAVALWIGGIAIISLSGVVALAAWANPGRR